jgi:antitoxin component HigA of HigAB toxin-antitoxin module
MKKVGLLAAVVFEFLQSKFSVGEIQKQRRALSLQMLQPLSPCCPVQSIFDF